jgi:hypothetical protein
LPRRGFLDFSDEGHWPVLQTISPEKKKKIRVM